MLYLSYSYRKLCNFSIIPILETNLEWRPFDVNVSKKDRKAGIEPTKDMYHLSPNTIKVMLGILGSFYTYLLQEDVISANPVALIRQKSKFIRKDDTSNTVIRRLSNKQWETLISVASNMAHQNPNLHERTLFMLIWYAWQSHLNRF